MKYFTNMTTSEMLEQIIEDAGLSVTDEQIVRRELDTIDLTGDVEQENVKLHERIESAKDNLEDLITNLDDQGAYRANEQTIAELNKLLESLK